MNPSLSRVRAPGAIALAVMLVLGLATPTPAQCFGPDNLGLGPCCGTADLSLPLFPPQTTGGLAVCWGQCTVIGQEELTVSWSPPSVVSCGEFISQLTVVDAAGNPVLSGLMRLSYTRTWDEDDAFGVLRQVWRFVVKVDIEPVAGGTPNPCIEPNCLDPVGPHPSAYYYGYLDYTSCDLASWQSALVLYHGCDRFVHTPGFSDRPGVFHPSSAFAIVAPHSATQPFVPMDLPAPSGALSAEATRTVDPTAPPLVCTVEDRVVDGSLDALARGCLCIPSTNPKHQTVREFTGETFCTNALGDPGTWLSLNIFPTLPWFHVVSTSLGAWTSDLEYPGTEQVWVDEGLFVRQDACAGDFVELKYGATTAEGWLVNPSSPLNYRAFTDMADNWSAPLSGPFTLPIFGSVQQTDQLIYVNQL